MDVKEKLMELFAPTSLDFEKAVFLTDYLVKNGVTVQEWVSVEERLPEKSGTYLVIGKSGTPHTDHFYEHKPYHRIFISRDVTHWMPLPEPPKGGSK